MGARGTKWVSHTGFAVLSIPDTGLFFRDGRLVTGHGIEIEATELILFSRRADADAHAQSQQQKWAGKGTRKWEFPVIPVLVSERQ